jgi:hypothetical protein
MSDKKRVVSAIRRVYRGDVTNLFCFKKGWNWIAVCVMQYKNFKKVVLSWTFEPGDPHVGEMVIMDRNIQVTGIHLSETRDGSNMITIIIKRDGKELSVSLDSISIRMNPQCWGWLTTDGNEWSRKCVNLPHQLTEQF